MITTNYTLAEYCYPRELLPKYHTALYQLLVGVEQQHSKDILLLYAKQLRLLADQSFVNFRELETNPDLPEIKQLLLFK